MKYFEYWQNSSIARLSKKQKKSGFNLFMSFSIFLSWKFICCVMVSKWIPPSMQLDDYHHLAFTVEPVLGDLFLGK